MFDQDIEERIPQIVPPVLRKPKWLAFMTALMLPLQTYNDWYVDMANDALEEARWTGQTMIVEHALNKRWPDALGLIRIDQPLSNMAVEYTFYQSEQQDNPTVYYQSEGQLPLSTFYQPEYSSAVDFVVMVPQSLFFNTNEMRAYVNLFRLAGMKFSIQTF